MSAPEDIPPEIQAAAAKVARWFAERNIKEWKLDGVQNRVDLPTGPTVGPLWFKPAPDRGNHPPDYDRALVASCANWLATRAKWLTFKQGGETTLMELYASELAHIRDRMPQPAPPPSSECWACNDTGTVTTSSNGSGLVEAPCAACEGRKE